VDKGVVEAVGDILFKDPACGAYAVLDGASVPGLVGRLYADRPDYVCLFRGQLEPDMMEVAPYLVQLKHPSPFTDWVLGEGLGNHWGILVISPADIRQLRGHFRSLVTVTTEDGRSLLFRFYDPRVLRTYLPTCNADEVEAVFGPADALLAEDEAPDVLLRFRRGGEGVRKEALPLKTAGRGAAGKPG